jgi:hypothetical protein
MHNMSKKRGKRAFKLIAFKAYYDADKDILEWWEAIAEGERSSSIRDLIREQLGVPRQPRKGTAMDLAELLEVRRDTLWIRDALQDMPAYLERIVQQVAVGGHSPRASPLTTNDTRALTDEDAERRTKRMRKATW